MLLLVTAHLLVAALCPVLVRTLGLRAFWLVATVPAATTVWALTQTSRVADGRARVEVTGWVPSLGLDLAFRMGALQWLLVLVVAGIGAVVLAYCRWYFSPDSRDLGRFAGVLVAFVGAMLGLVLADDLLLVYVFWELTTVFSFVLIGHDPTRRAHRQSALQALLVTTFGGLAMLVGMLLLGHAAGTFRISEILADPPTGTAVTVAVLLVLVGAATKSALLPFHFWLPGAMVAPTPVSAYLHAASMVKAGVYLVALLAPAFAASAGWRPALLVLGVATMLLGGWRALRQIDVKLLLAYGTVSQLGFLLVVLGLGTRSATLAGLGLLLAHALFKAALFLVVGVIDRSTGTRDMHELSGLGRRLPVLAAAATLAAASMAGVPPLLGFVSKEASLVALVDLAREGEGTGLGPVAGWAVLLGVVAGSVLTAAYSARFVWGAFATKPGVEPTRVDHVPAGFAAGPVLLTGLTVALGLLGPTLTGLLAPAVEVFPEGAHEPELTLWHGPGLALLLSGVVLALGAAAHVGRAPVARLQGSWGTDRSLEHGYRLVMRGVDRAAVEVTGLTQRGSVSTYLAIILLVVLVVPGSTLLLADASEIDVVAWDTPAQAVVGLVAVGAAVMATRARRRLRAVVLAGVTGYGAALLFVLHGAPDLALTQILVETVSLLVFVLVLRRLPEYFTDRPLARSRWWRVALAVAVGTAVAGFMLVAGSARTAAPVSIAFPPEAVSYGGGKNIVNVVLVDVRAWDTLGELSVLVAAATGVASLVFVTARDAGIRRVHEIPYPAGVRKIPTRPGRRAWLPGSRTLSPDRRSIVFEVITRLLFHAMVVFSVYLLIAGHNLPGGGFAAGMVTGLALAVRYLAGGRYELDEAAPIDAGRLIGAGLAVAAASAMAPLAFGGSVLQSADITIHLGPLGEPHLVTSVFFDIGVYLVVIGLVLDLLRALGSRIDRHILADERAALAARRGDTAPDPARGPTTQPTDQPTDQATPEGAR